MLPGMPDDAQLTYNAVTFGTLTSSSLSGEPIKDDAGRVTKFVAWTLSVKSYVTAPPGGDTDAAMQSIAARLSVCAEHLTYRGRGFDFDVNGPGPSDAFHGPIPTLISFQPLGTDQAARVEWKVKFHLPYCDDDINQAALLMLNYETAYSVDADQYTTRHVGISVEIPMTNRGRFGPAVDTVDRTLEQVLPPLIPGFRRGEVHRRLSRNGSRMEVSFDDVEVPRALPRAASVADLKWKVSSKLQGMGFTQWHANLSGTIRVVAGRDPALAWNVFWLTLDNKLRTIERNVNAPVRNGPRRPDVPGEVDGPLVPGRKFIFTDLSVETDEYGKDTRVNLSLLIFRSSLQSILRDSGMWNYLGNGMAAWQGSTYFRNGRGSAGLRHRVEDDPVINVCNTVPNRPGPPPQKQTGDPGRFPGGLGGPPDNRFQAQTAVVGPTDPRLTGQFGVTGQANGGDQADAEDSWVQWWCELEVLEHDHVARHKPVGAPTTNRPPAAPVNNYRATARLVLPDLPPERSSVPDEIQEVAAPSYTVVLRGGAIRAFHEIEHPRLLRVGGVEAVQAWRRYLCRPVSRCGPVVIWGARWEVGYLLPSAPNGPLPVPADPFLGLDGRA
jgi:hypothetical protein